MPKRQDDRTHDQSGRTSSGKARTILTDTPNSQEIFREEAPEHKNTSLKGQDQKIPARDEGEQALTQEANSQSQQLLGTPRAGNESNATQGQKPDSVHEHHHDHNHPQLVGELEVGPDLHPNFLAGDNHGVRSPHPEKFGRTGDEIKELHRAFPELTNDQLHRLDIAPDCARLAQGARYIDLRHLEDGEFIALANTTAGPDNYYVAKHDTDYELWDILLELSNR